VAGSYSGLKVYLYRNNGDSTFTSLSTSPMEGLFHSSAQVFDYNNDGLSDIFISGHHGPKALLYKNTGNFTFVTEATTIIPVGYTAVATADFIPDGKPDLLLSGEITAGGARRTRMYQNQFMALNNELPMVPSTASSYLGCGKAILKWNRGSDSESPASSLTYSVYLADSTGALVVHPGADLADGARFLREPGNAGTDTFLIVHRLKPGRYTWGVQTVDLLNGASNFTGEQILEIPEMPLADAGPDKAVCYGFPFSIDESEVNYTPTGNYEWTSSGTGIFDDPASASPIYTPTFTDLSEGSVTLRFEVLNDYYCEEGSHDEKLITFAQSTIDVVGHSEEDVSVCEGTDTLLWFSANGTGLSFQWLVWQTEGYWLPVENETGTELSFTQIEPADAGSYAMVITDVSGCVDSVNVVIQLQVLDNPDVPVIVASDEGLAPTMGFADYEWIDASNGLAGTDSLFMPPSAGNYRVRVTDNGVCWSLSDAYSWNPVGIEKLHWEACSIYPIPADDHIHIRLPGKYDLNSATVSVYGLDGRMAGCWEITSRDMKIPLGNIKHGVYLVEIADIKGNYYRQAIAVQ
jgi:hypothetical protein